MLKTGKMFKMEYLLALTALLLLPCISLMQTRAATEVDRNRECSLTVSVETGGSIGSSDAYLEDFNRMYQQILEVTGTAPQIFRFPGGSINSYNGHIYLDIVAEMVRRGFVYFDWNAMTGDAVKKPPAPAVQVNNALSKAGAERVILLSHDSSKMVNTVAALPGIIEGYQTAGYTFAPLTPEVLPIVYAYPK